MKYFYRQIVRIQRCCVGRCEHTTKVTKLGDGYNIRIFLNGGLNQEGRCYNKCDIGRTIAELLRWEDKCGNFSDMSIASRERARIKFNNNRG